MNALQLFKLGKKSVDHVEEPAQVEISTDSIEEKLAFYEGQLSQLAEQKNLHAQALKEMYQFLCKIDAHFRSEIQQLRDELQTEKQRSANLFEMTKDLWEIVEDMEEEKSTARILPIRKERDEALLRIGIDSSVLQDDFSPEFRDIPGIIPVSPASA